MTQTLIGGGERSPDSPVSVVGVSRIGGDVAAMDEPMVAKAATFLGLAASLNLFLFLFNLLPILPLDGGHVAGALYEGARRRIARMRGRARTRVRWTSPGCCRWRTWWRESCWPWASSCIWADIVKPDRHRLIGARRRAGRASGHNVGVTIGLGMPVRPAARPGAPPPDPPAHAASPTPSPWAATRPISVQSMCTTKTTTSTRTLQQIAELTAAGCDIVRVACPRQEDADALPAIAKQEQHPGDRRHPLPAQVHLRRHRRRLRGGAGQPRQHQGVRRPGRRGRQSRQDAGIPIRIGVNAGSLDKRLLEKYGKATPEALVESALWEASLFEEHGFGDIKISVKHNDPVVMVAGYSCSPKSATTRCTSASPRPVPRSRAPSSRPSRSARCCAAGIGDTIRVSLSAPPVEEVKVGNQILESLNLRPRGLEIVSCPSCGRAQVDVYTLAKQVTAGLEGLDVPLRVAVMGCVVNGPGEAREADLGVASGNGKGQIFVKGEVIKTVPEAQIVETLIEEAMKLAETMADADRAPGSPRRPDRCGPTCSRGHL